MTPVMLFRVGGLGALLVVCQPASPTRGPGEASAQVATLHEARAAHTATLLPSGQVLVVGGMDDGGGALASVELFDPADNAVQELESLAERRVSHTATLLADGRVLITGGYNGGYLSSVEVFDPTTRRFPRPVLSWMSAAAIRRLCCRTAGCYSSAE